MSHIFHEPYHIQILDVQYSDPHCIGLNSLRDSKFLQMALYIKLLQKPINGSYRLNDKFFWIYRECIFDKENIDPVIVFR